MRSMRIKGIHNFGYYPDDQFKNSPNMEILKKRAFGKSSAFSVAQQKAPHEDKGLLFTAFSGANDGARTRDNQNHNLGLYQLSYVRH